MSARIQTGRQADRQADRQPASQPRRRAGAYSVECLLGSWSRAAFASIATLLPAGEFVSTPRLAAQSVGSAS